MPKRPYGFGDLRQTDSHRRSAADAVGSFNAAAVRLRDGLADGEAETRAAGPGPLSAIEFFKDVLLLFRVEARAAIADIHPDFALRCAAGQFDRHVPAGVCFDGVLHQIQY